MRETTRAALRSVSIRSRKDSAGGFLRRTSRSGIRSAAGAGCGLAVLDGGGTVVRRCSGVRVCRVVGIPLLATRERVRCRGLRARAYARETRGDCEPTPDVRRSAGAGCLELLLAEILRE